MIWADIVARDLVHVHPVRGKEMQPLVRDIHLYTTTNKCLQCLIELMYTVF